MITTACHCNRHRCHIWAAHRCGTPLGIADRLIARAARPITSTAQTPSAVNDRHSRQCHTIRNQADHLHPVLSVREQARKPIGRVVLPLDLYGIASAPRHVEQAADEEQQQEDKPPVVRRDEHNLEDRARRPCLVRTHAIIPPGPTAATPTVPEAAEPGSGVTLIASMRDQCRDLGDENDSAAEWLAMPRHPVVVRGVPLKEGAAGKVLVHLVGTGLEVEHTCREGGGEALALEWGLWL